MDTKERELEILRKFADIAALAGIKGEIDEEMPLYAAGFELDDGRSQMVYVRPLPEAIGGKMDGVCIVSPCRRKGIFTCRGFAAKACAHVCPAERTNS